MSRSNSKARIIISIICIILALITAITTVFVFRPYYYENYYIAPIPTNLSSGWSNEPEPIFSDFYVSASGSEDGDGSFERPFATIEQAQKAIRKLKMDQISHAVVAIMAGTYNVGSIEFTQKDSGTEVCRVIYSAYGDGEVIFDGGIEPGEAFESSDKALIEIKDAEYITLSGITFRNCAGCAVRANGNNIDISSCTVQNAGTNGIEINGTMISINSCRISDTGASAITINGGNRSTLTPGNCSADNNLISNTSVFDKSAPSVIIDGTGNAFTNNEIINSPSTAVYYSGNANKIEYNYIHNTCLEAETVSAIDSPMRWDCYGNFIRYNLISTLGNGANTPTALTACSGSQIRGNMFINIKGVAMDFNTGRDINFTNNILVNCSVPLKYLTGEISADDPAWKELKASPYKSEAWKSAFPDCHSLTDDYAAMTDPLFAANPANSFVKDNIILQVRAQIGEISAEANTFSVIDGNAVLELSETEIFIDAKNGNYRINEDGEIPQILPDFRDIPFDSIGRY